MSVHSRVLFKSIGQFSAFEGTYKRKVNHIKNLYGTLAIAAIIVLSASYSIVPRLYSTTYEKETSYPAITIAEASTTQETLLDEKSSAELEEESIYCSCIKTARAEGTDIPYNTNAEDLQPNSVPVVGGLVLIKYPNIEHVARIIAFLENGLQVVEGLELPTGECVRRIRTIPFDYPFIRGFWSATIARNNITNVSELIKKYSAEYGADENLALNIACAESCTRDKNTNEVYINPDAKNPTSTASGVFQFIESTWDFACEGDRMNAEDNIKCGVKLLAAGDMYHWNASRTEGFGGGWANAPYYTFAVAN